MIDLAIIQCTVSTLYSGKLLAYGGVVAESVESQQPKIDRLPVYVHYVCMHIK